MKKKIVTGIMLTLLIISMLMLAFNLKSAKANPQLLATTKLSIIPSTIIGPPPSVGESFTINITITNVIDLTGWCVGLAWNASILNCTSWTTLFDTAVMGPSWHWLEVEGTINNTVGEVNPPYACALKAGYPMKSGSGTIAQVSFTVLDYGFTWINLTNIIIMSNWVEIPVDVTNGTVTVTAPTKLSIVPSTIIGPPPGLGENFTVDINIENVINLTGGQIGLKWDPTVLQCNNFTLLPPGPPSDWLIIAGEIDNTNGRIYPPYGYAFVGAIPPSGSGTLAQVNFTVLDYGFTWINLTDIFIESNWVEIPVDVTNGTFTLFPVHDVAITSVTTSPTEVTAGETVSINVTVKNEGDFTENFNVTAYYDNTEIDTQTVTNLATLAEENLTFTWDTTDVDTGEYMIKAVASTVPGETRTADNTYIDGTITVTAPTKLSIIPASITGPPPGIGESFTVDIIIRNVVNLRTWCIGLAWNASILNCTSWTTLFDTAVMGPEEDWLAVDGTINNTVGEVNPPYACALKAGRTPKSGIGTLAQVNFTVLDYGFTWINLTNIIIMSNPVILVKVTNGTVQIGTQGDLNDDGHVNLGDLSILADHWYGHDPESGKTNDPRADINSDGLIDLSDLSIMADHWYKGPLDPH